MQPTAVPHTEIPGASKLFLDYLYHFDRVAGFFAHHPYDRASFDQAARRLNYPSSRRAALIAALRGDNPDSSLLDRLAQPKTVVVVTGQQTGLFAGPSYTIYKALTAVRLAHRLTDAGIPAVPVFWCATEDHDFDEVRRVWLFDAAHQPQRLSIDGAFPGQPVGPIAPASYPVVELSQMLAGFPFAGEVMEWVRRSYAPGVTMGQAFRNLLGQMLAPHEMLFLDPLRAPVRALAAPLLREAARASEDLIRIVQQRNGDLAAAGYHVQVQVSGETPLFFQLTNGRRNSLPRRAEGYPELERVPETLSPNALLRPVMQDYLLPTIAHVAGPAEIAYLAQSHALYGRLGVAPPVEVPRAAFTLLDARSQKLLDRYGLTFQSLFAGEEAVKEAMAKRLMPEGFKDSFRNTEAQVKSALATLRQEINAFDHTLGAAMDKSTAKILYQISKIERKVAREALRRREAAVAEAAHVSRLLLPHRHLQERFYSILPFLAKHGPDVVERILENINLDSPDHILLPLS